MAIGHAAAIILYQLAHRDASRCQLDAWILDPARHRPRAWAGMAGLALSGEPVGTLLDDVANPPQGLDVVVERRTAKQADLGDVGRTMARQATLAFDALQHRALLAADIRARAAPQLDEARCGNAGGLERRDLRAQDGKHRGIF